MRNSTSKSTPTNPKPSSSSSSSSSSFHRYLKPGALAQIRNCKISARSHKLASKFLLSTLENNIVGSQIALVDREVKAPPLLKNVYFGPHCVQRKKLLAPRSLFLVNVDALTAFDS